VSAGAKQSVFTSSTRSDPQEEGHHPRAYWVSYPEGEMLRRRVIVTPETDLSPGAWRNIKRVVRSHTLGIIVQQPEQSSGCVYKETFVQEMVDFCETKGST